MEIISLTVEIQPGRYGHESQSLSITCRTNRGDFHSEEAFPRDDLRSMFDRIFDLSKIRIQQMLEGEEWGEPHHGEGIREHSKF